jgi:uncharacterized protein (DUF342 family)
MTPEKDESIAKLLDDCQQMVRRFDSLTAKDRIDEISADVQKDTLRSFEEALEPLADAFFDVFVEEDAMSVAAEFRPPSGGGKPLDLDRIEKALFDKAVTHGIVWEEISKTLDECNLELKVRTGVVIARGTPPIPFVPASIRLNNRWISEKSPEADVHKTLNFKEISPFLLVTKGDLLALRMGEVVGVSGTDVLGREVPYPTAPPPEWTPGPNVADTPAGFEAAVDGRLVLAAPSFSVNPILELKEGVDYRTGNIHFKGDVLLSGRVSAGFTVEAEGSLNCRDVLDAFRVKVGGDLISPGGIIGNGGGRVEVGGAVSVKFVENAYLLAQGSVRAEACVLNSVVKTRGRFALGDKGILAGGQIHALDGVEVHQIGTSTGPRTELFVGLDYQGMEKIVWIRERTTELLVQLKKLDSAIPYAGFRIQELMAAAKKLRLEIIHLAETARVQLLNLGQNEAAEVVVHGTVFPSTQIGICHVQFLVTQRMSGVRFFLDKRKGLVAVVPLGAGNTTPSGLSQKKH